MKTVGLWPVLLILILNSILAIVVFILAFYKKEKERNTMFMLSWFIFIVPFMGVLYILSGLLINYFIRKSNVDMSDISFSQDREKLILPPNQEAEMNYVPIHDAMAISDTASLRRLLLDTMLNNAKKRVSNIAVAMNSNDTEASHYVATMIMDVLSELRSIAQSMIERMRRLPENVELNLLTFDFIYEFICMKIMSDIEQEAYIYILDDIAENLFNQNLWHMSATHYLRITDVFISIKDYNMADKWSSRANQYRPNMLDTYKAKLHLYFEQHNYNAFFDCLDELRNSEISVDKEIIDLFHIYNG